MSKWYASCILLRVEKGKEPEKWKDLHVGGLDGISCQHLQVLSTNLLQKHWEWQEERNPVLRHCKYNTSNDMFSRCKSAHKMAAGKGDDQLIQYDNKLELETSYKLKLGPR